MKRRVRERLIVLLLTGIGQIFVSCAADPDEEDDDDREWRLAINCNYSILRNYVEDYFEVSLAWTSADRGTINVSMDINNEESYNLQPVGEPVVSNADTYSVDSVYYDGFSIQIEPQHPATGLQPFTIDFTLRCEDVIAPLDENVLVPVTIVATPAEPAVEGEDVPFEMTLNLFIRE